MRVHCAWQSVYSDISKVGARGRDRRRMYKPSRRKPDGDVALVEDDGTLIDRRHEWLLSEAARAFYESHEDRYDFVSFFPQSQAKPVKHGAPFDTYHVGVFNDIQGIGKGFRDRRRDYREGGSKCLQSVHLFPPPGELPDDPAATIPGNNDSTLSLIAQEVGHRWSSFIWFRDRERDDLPSSSLLGRDRSHWSFFLDTEGSPMEGNQWQYKDGYFISSGKLEGYCQFDLYLMGLLAPGEVKPLSLIVNHDGAAHDPALTASSRPAAGVKIGGEPKTITIQDVIDFEGPRSPSARDVPKRFRQAFVLLLRRGEKPRAAAIQKLNRIRVRWGEHFRAATGNRGEMDTRL